MGPGIFEAAVMLLAWLCTLVAYMASGVAIVRYVLLSPLKLVRPLPPGRQFTLGELFGLVFLLQLPLAVSGWFARQLRYRESPTAFVVLIMALFGLLWWFSRRHLARSSIPVGWVRIALQSLVLPLGIIAAGVSPWLVAAILFEWLTSRYDDTEVQVLFIAIPIAVLLACTLAVRLAVRYAGQKPPVDEPSR